LIIYQGNEYNCFKFNALRAAHGYNFICFKTLL
jgi:hypothetical protein